MSLICSSEWLIHIFSRLFLLVAAGRRKGQERTAGGFGQRAGEGVGRHFSLLLWPSQAAAIVGTGKWTVMVIS